MDLFKNYDLQREELLARIAQELQLNRDRINRMETAYKAISDVLKADDDFFKDLKIEVYAQGSKRIGTTVRPINGDDFDLDIVLHIYDPYYRHTPEEIYNALISVISKNDTYKPIMELKKRCVRLNYKSDFHMDILPACMPDKTEKQAIKIPEKALKFWSSGNPKGFAEWFKIIAKSGKDSMLKRFSNLLIKAEVETEDLPNELYTKTPLQRAVQLVKRYRDIYFEGEKNSVSSIVITTLCAQYYQGENSIYETIDNILSRIKINYTEAINKGSKFKILNPVNNEEDFTDSWTEEHYRSFFNFIKDFYKKWENLKSSFEESGEDYIGLFGEGLYKESLQKQIKKFSDTSDNELIKASGIILSNTANTDSHGRINAKRGMKNQKHHSYGGTY